MIKKLILIALSIMMIVAIIIMEDMGYVNFSSPESFNSGKGIIAVILAVCAVVSAVYTMFFSGQSPQKSVNVTGGISTAGDHSPIVTGDNASITINITQDEYVAELKQRIDETEKQLADKNANNEVLKAQLRDLQAKLDNRDRAFRETVQTLQSTEQSLRELQPELPEEKFNEALSALANGDTSKADQLLAQVEADADKNAQKHVLRVAKAAYQRGLIADNEVRYNDANAHFTKAINLDADNATYLNEAALLRDTMGLYREAEPIHQQALTIRQQTLGENHADTATSYNDIAVNLDYQGRYDEAETIHRQALTIRKQTLGENHADTAESYNNISTNLNYQGRYEEAEPLHQKALAIRKQTLGENHADTATSYGNIASNLDDQGRYDEAEPLLKKAIAVMEAASLADHPNTQATRDSLRALQEKIKR
jgi:tetratricopeptide (TPR) repeat protein